MELVKIDATYHPVVILTLNRGEKRNALNITLMSQLSSALEKIAADPQIRVVILRGEGSVFCAGLDLSETRDPAKSDASSHAITQLFKTISACSIPIIALVHGAVLAGGLGLMAGCDFIIAEEKTLFGLPELQRGLVPAIIMPQLIRRLNFKDLNELLFFEETMDARKALTVGLINRIVRHEQLIPEALYYAEQVLKGAPEATRKTKQLLTFLSPSSFKESESMLQGFHMQMRGSPEAKEGIAAFLEKRNPNWVKIE